MVTMPRFVTTCVMSGTGILPVSITGVSPMGQDSLGRARMALRLMGKMPMLRRLAFSYTF
ncbi:MAG TPA: hypothetical protein PKN00_18940 [Sedimentisphaerales bacterium]|jgi:hypothetical protein|nr:hypothetical protein [Sedimentisphaerales bacterium]